jgi:ATP/maltotriose-dependent transcriptional regulator MalT
MENDRTVVTSESVMTAIEQAQISEGKIIHFLSHKSPLRNQKGKVIGTLGLSYSIEQESWNADRLHEVALIVGANGAEQIRKFHAEQQQATYELSERQLDCLVLLAKGLKTKDIARRLNLSPRTVEHYIDSK